VRDQRPQLSMIDSAGKRDIILRPSLSLQPNRQSNPCSVQPTWLRSSGAATRSWGSAVLHWRLTSSRPTLCHRDPFQTRPWSRPPLRPLLHPSRSCLSGVQTLQKFQLLRRSLWEIRKNKSCAGHSHRQTVVSPTSQGEPPHIIACCSTKQATSAMNFIPHVTCNSIHHVGRFASGHLISLVNLDL
jgi:hypothetical protein